MSSSFVTTNPLLHIKLCAVPIDFWTDSEGSRILRLPDSRHVKVVSPTHRPPLHPNNYSWYSFLLGGTRWRSWLRQCATNRKVVGSIPDGVIGFFSLTYSFRPHYVHGVDSGLFPAGKSGRCVRLTTLPPSCADCLEIWDSQPSGILTASASL
jgi:hypothetical protein